MPSGFEKIRFGIPDQADDRSRRVGVRGISARGTATVKEDGRSFTNDEAAARFYLGKVFDVDHRPRVRGLAAPQLAEAVPDLKLRSTQTVPNSKDRLLLFDQTHSSIPIFGSRVVVQINQDRELVGIGGDVAGVSDVPTVASVSAAEALKSIAKFTGVDAATLAGVQPPEIVFFHEPKKGAWHLVHFFKNVPAVPPQLREEIKQGKTHGHGLGRSPRELHPLVNYLIDAHDAKVVFYYSAAPMVTIPSECEGLDEHGAPTKFWGLQVPNGYEMVDPRRSIKTYDMMGQDIALHPIPQVPVRNAANNWQTTNTAAVSAHVHATKVYNFYKSVLLRDGIDDKGMDLVSIVNVTYKEAQNPPEWHNAVWYDNKMWYGRIQSNGAFQSYSRYLDVIAHELTHGVTQHTSGLVYKDQSGALNESFSDIFGVIIANWDPKNPNRDAATWNWQIGAGLGRNGGPLRDVSNPKATQDPDHMDDFLDTTSDDGGVHTNSNIHNKAAYNLFMAKDANGVPVFEPMDAAELFYLTLSQLSSMANFSDTLNELVAVATIFYSGDPAKRDDRIKHIRDAYGKVGIT